MVTELDIDTNRGASLQVQWIRLHPLNAGGEGLIPDLGTRIPHAEWQGQKKEGKKNTQRLFSFHGIRPFMIRPHQLSSPTSTFSRLLETHSWPCQTNHMCVLTFTYISVHAILSTLSIWWILICFSKLSSHSMKPSLSPGARVNSSLHLVTPLLWPLLHYAIITCLHVCLHSRLSPLRAVSRSFHLCVLST